MEKVESIGNGRADILNNMTMREFFEKASPNIELSKDQKRLLDIAEQYRDSYDAMMELENIIADIPLQTIEGIKRRIKYSKNPLEIKQLNKHLNQMYKDRRR